MARKFIDTSALVKLYRQEPESPVVEAEIDTDDELVIAQITPIEMRSAFLGMVRQQVETLTVAQAQLAVFVNDLKHYTIVPMDSAVLSQVEVLLDTYAIVDGLRPLDAMQIASACETNKVDPIDGFITTDATQRRVAAACGFQLLP